MGADDRRLFGACGHLWESEKLQYSLSYIDKEDEDIVNCYPNQSWLITTKNP